MSSGQLSIKFGGKPYKLQASAGHFQHAPTPMQFSGTHAAPPPTGLQFPLLGAYLIAGSVQTSFGQAAYQANVAKFGVAMIGLYPGWSSGGFNMQTAAAAVKAINPNTKLFPYTNLMEFEPGVGASGSAYSPLWVIVNANNWFLRTAYPAGSITDADALSQQGINFCSPHVGTASPNVGIDVNHMRATWTAANEVTSNWDGVFLDNVFYQPRVSADYSESGSSQTASAAAQTWRNGYAAYVPLLKSALPAGKNLVIGNTADWANGSINGYNQLLNGGVIESIIGQSYSYESQGWAQMMNAYKIVMNATAAPQLQVFSHDNTNTADYQGMRYGLCSCLLDNAYYYFNVNNATIALFDEYKFNLGQGLAGPNNPTNGTYSSGGITVYQNGVWRRDFEHGIALVNPKGNGSQTINLGQAFTHLTGTQAPTINNGTSVSSVTLADRDGLIMSR